jgi:hypothetical protein
MLIQAVDACVTCRYTTSACPVTMIDSSRHSEYGNSFSFSYHMLCACSPNATHLVMDWPKEFYRMSKIFTTSQLILKQNRPVSQSVKTEKGR